MKQLLLLIIIFLTLTSCQSKMGKQFFDYDEIDYYANNIDESTIGDLYDNQSKSLLDSLKMGVLLGEIPHSISDTSFINYLEKIGYKKSLVASSKFAEIDKIFRKKPMTEMLATACIYVYRDILIFKKHNKVVGTVKICLGCNANQIQGAKVSTESFGRYEDYTSLEALLRNEPHKTN